MDTALFTAHLDEELRVIIGAPIASVLILVAAVSSAWGVFGYRLANRRSQIDMLDGRLKAKDEEIEFLRRGRDADLVDWFSREATREINRIRSDPQHPFNKGDKAAVIDMAKLYMIANIHKYGVETGQK